MIIKLSIILLFVAFILLLAYWVVRSEQTPKKPTGLFNPNKSYKKAKEMGLNFPSQYAKVGLKFPDQYKDVLPGL